MFGPLYSAFPVYPFAISPVVPASTRSLLFKLQSTLFSVLASCLLASSDALLLIPLVTMFRVPSLVR
jgi:hypothetical protein